MATVVSWAGNMLSKVKSPVPRNSAVLAEFPDGYQITKSLKQLMIKTQRIHLGKWHSVWAGDIQLHMDRICTICFKHKNLKTGVNIRSNGSALVAFF